MKRIWIENVKQDAEERTSSVDAQRHPPNQLFVKFLFKILQNSKPIVRLAKRPSSETRDGRAQLFGRVPVVDGKANVCASYDENSN